MRKNSLEPRGPSPQASDKSRLRTQLAFSMLPEQDSATNYTASTISFADPTFDTFLTDDNSSTAESQTTQNVIKQEHDNMTNQGLRQHEQHTRRETQQQHNTPRPGPPRINIFDQFEDTEFKELRSALAADQASASPFQLQAHNGVHRPCTPPNLINKCRSLLHNNSHAWLTQTQANSQSHRRVAHIPWTKRVKPWLEVERSIRHQSKAYCIQAERTLTSIRPNQ